MSSAVETYHYQYIDPYEIQSFPPREVDEAITAVGIEYSELIDWIAGLLSNRSPRFAQDLAPYLASYFHDHNFPRPLSEDESACLCAMLADPEKVKVETFRAIVPKVLLKACTLAVETFIQNRPSWVLKAIPQFVAIRQSGSEAPP